MKKIAIVGLHTIPNMGDQILCEVSRYLTEQIAPDFETKDVDVCPRRPEDYKGIEYIKYRLSRKMLTTANKKFSYEDSGEDRYKYEYSLWKLRLYKYYKKAFSDVDAIIFAGGGFLKFRTQGLNYYVELILKVANQRGLPVMMSGMGIEGYDEKDVRCQKLKAAINSPSVKVITTRDDIDILQNKYITAPHIKTARVGDPALWTPECYGVSKNKDNSRVGINIIRGKVFKDYGNSSSYDDVKDFYKSLIAAADKAGLDWVLFSNGMKSDQEFGKAVLSEMGLESAEKLLPAPKTSMELLNMIRAFKCIFGARLHACITAYSMDVPAVGFIWNEKTRFFADITNKRENFFEESDMDTDKIVNRIQEAAKESYDTSIRDNLKSLTKDYMRDFLNQIR